MAEVLTKSATLVCALVPAYNPGPFLEQAVQSLLSQTRRPDRIIVIDDGSTDDSLDLLNAWVSSGEIEVIRNPINIGKARSLNQAFTEIDADYFILQDADDISLPKRVERQIAFMEANPQLGCSSTFIEYINASGKGIGRGKLDLISQQRLKDYLDKQDAFALFCPATVIRGEVAKDPSLQFRERFWPADDIDLWNRVAEAGWQVLAQPEFLVQYRIHGSSAVSTNTIRTRMQFEWVKASLRARRSGTHEPSREEFMNAWNGVGYRGRLNRERKLFARSLYRSGGFAAAERNFVEAFGKILVSLLTDPLYVGPRLFQQILKRES